MWREASVGSAGNCRSEIEVSEACSVVAVEDGLSQDILKSDEQWGSIVVQEECSHLDRSGGASVVVKKDADATERSGDSRLV